MDSEPMLYRGPVILESKMIKSNMAGDLYNPNKVFTKPPLHYLSADALLSATSSTKLDKPRSHCCHDIKIFIDKVLGIRVVTYQENFGRDFDTEMNGSMACGPCPDYLYDFQQLRNTWQTCCFDKDSGAGVQAKNFFKSLFQQHLKNSVFVTAFDCSDEAKLLVDYSLYCLVKDKLERRAAVKVPDIAPVRLSKRKLPIVKHMFASGKDLDKCIDTLTRKNEEIVFQKEIRGVRAMEGIREDLSESCRRVLALDLEVYEDDPTKILEIGMSIFEMDSLDRSKNPLKTCRHFIIKENAHLQNKDMFPDNRDQFQFGKTEKLCLLKARKAVQEAVDGVDYIVAHSSGNLSAYLKERGIYVANKELVDTKVLYMAAYPGAKNHTDLASILDALEIEYDHNNNMFAAKVLNNAGNDAYFTMEIFKVLVWNGFDT